MYMGHLGVRVFAVPDSPIDKRFEPARARGGWFGASRKRRAADKNQAMTTEEQPLILRAKRLCRTFGSKVALDNVSLFVRAGEIIGCVGPANAGKTTLLRTLAGLLNPSSGRIRIESPAEVELKSIVGFVPANFGVYARMRVHEFLDFFAKAHQIAVREREARVNECLAICDLIEHRRHAMTGLSPAVRERAGIAFALLHNPRVLLLDDPFANLEPRDRIDIGRLLRDLSGMGKAVVVTSRTLPDVADLAESLALLHCGNLIARGPMRTVLRDMRRKRLIEIRVMKFSRQAKEVLAAAPGKWEAIDDATEGMLRYETMADEKQLAESLLRLLKRGIPVVGYHEVPAEVDEGFNYLAKSA